MIIVNQNRIHLNLIKLIDSKAEKLDIAARFVSVNLFLYSFKGATVSGRFKGY